MADGWNVKDAEGSGGPYCFVLVFFSLATPLPTLRVLFSELHGSVVSVITFDLVPSYVMKVTWMPLISDQILLLLIQSCHKHHSYLRRTNYTSIWMDSIHGFTTLYISRTHAMPTLHQVQKIR
jgi:hypothetical protein